MKVYTKNALIKRLKEIHEMGWILNVRPGNAGGVRSDRGFMIVIDRDKKKVLVSFDSKVVDVRHAPWLDSIRKKGNGLGELDPQPYWGFADLEHKAGTKLLNCFYVQANVKRENGREFFFYRKALMLEKFDFERFLIALEKAFVLVDFDARTGHNHGTKFRLRQDQLPFLYANKTEVF